MKSFFIWIGKFLFSKKEKQAEEAPLTDGQLAILKAQYKKLKDKAAAESNADNKRREEDKHKHDDVCPKCQSTDVNDRIKRFEGNIDGKSSGSSWSALSFGESQSSGYIKGKFDTNEVNKCNSCQHEWKKFKGALYTGSYEIIEQNLRFLNSFIYAIKKVKNVKWDKFDLKETHKSLEEKQADELKKAKNSWTRKAIEDFWSEFSTEVIIQAAKDSSWHRDTFFEYMKDKEVLNMLKDEFGIRSIKEIYNKI